ncbi:hypothetical protein [Niabella sp.]|uniref:hypothetical protein n=1 Tax=Niabella sp. TaxID=1962976 RepID=UPI00262CAADF|nr:hypothetical protein [Niabella sp.]
MKTPVVKGCSAVAWLPENEKTIITAMPTIMTVRGYGCCYIAATIATRTAGTPHPIFLLNC